MQKITTRIVDAIRAARKAGVSYRKIAVDLGISFHTARRYASDINLEAMRRQDRQRYLAREQKPELVERRRAHAAAYMSRQRAMERDRRDGMTLIDIAKKYDVHRETVSRVTSPAAAKKMRCGEREHKRKTYISAKEKEHVQ